MNTRLVASPSEWIRLKLEIIREARSAMRRWGVDPTYERPDMNGMQRPEAFPAIVVWDVQPVYGLMDSAVPARVRVDSTVVMPGAFRGGADQAVADAGIEDVLQRARAAAARDMALRSYVRVEAEGDIFRYTLLDDESVIRATPEPEPELTVAPTTFIDFERQARAAEERAFLFGNATYEPAERDTEITPRMPHESWLMYEGRVQAAQRAADDRPIAGMAVGDERCSCVACQDARAARRAEERPVEDAPTNSASAEDDTLDFDPPPWRPREDDTPDLDPAASEAVASMNRAFEALGATPNEERETRNRLVREARAAALRRCSSPEPVWSVSSAAPVSYLPCGHCIGCRGDTSAIDTTF